MAKDYFQDILPPGGAPKGRSIPISRKEEVPAPAPEPDFKIDEPEEHLDENPPERSIRNISVPQRPRPGRTPAPEVRPPAPAPGFLDEGSRKAKRWWLWGIAGLGVLLVGVLILLGLRPTTVTVIPKSHTVIFDAGSRITAYPAESAAAGALAYALETVELEDSEVVPTEGTEHAEEKASGTITVFNNYSTDSVKLIKNTRFETPNGLIFRTPAEVVVPGKKGSTPGQISVMVIADKAGDAYNVAPVAKLIVPGLKSTPAMYTGVYASSAAAMTGGFSGDRPAAAPGAFQNAQSSVRSRLETKARESVSARTNDADIVLTDLVTITYSSLPQTTEAGGGVRIHEKATVSIPVFSNGALAREVARFVSAEAESSATTLVPKDGFGAESKTTPAAGKPIELGLKGIGTLVWVVDPKALQEALAGKDEAAFETIVAGFAGVQEARARVEPFWKNSFPSDPLDIVVTVEAPKSGQ